MRRRKRARGSVAPVMGRLFAVYLVLVVVAGAVLVTMRARQTAVVPASASTPAEDGGQPLTLGERLRDAAQRVFDLVRPASARGTPAPVSSDEERMRSFGDRLLRAALETMGGLDPGDPRTMIRAELPVLMEPDIPAALGVPRGDVVAARASELRIEPDVLQAAAVAVEPWAAAAPTTAAAPDVSAAASDGQRVGTATISMSSSGSGEPSAQAPAPTPAPAPPVVASKRTGLAPSAKSSGPRVAVLHTHSSEAYRASQGTDYRWGKTDGVMKVGDVLTAELEKVGVKTVHSTKVHDYPNWTRSYAQAATTIRSILDKNSGIEAVIDVHRDAVPVGSGSLKPVTISGQKYARVIFIVADESSGLAHPDWRSNYAFAIKVSAALDKIAPGLSRGVAIHKGGRFNQQMHEHSIIVEIGGTTNSLEEATRSAKLVARAIAAAL